MEKFNFLSINMALLWEEKNHYGRRKILFLFLNYVIMDYIEMSF